MGESGERRRGGRNRIHGNEPARSQAAHTPSVSLATAPSTAISVHTSLPTSLGSLSTAPAQLLFPSAASTLAVLAHRLCRLPPSLHWALGERPGALGCGVEVLAHHGL